jgi:hypothetical protein
MKHPRLETAMLCLLSGIILILLAILMSYGL